MKGLIRYVMLGVLSHPAVAAPAEQTQPLPASAVPAPRTLDSDILAQPLPHRDGASLPGVKGGTAWQPGKALGAGAPPHRLAIHFVIPKNTCEQGEPLQELRGAVP